MKGTWFTPFASRRKKVGLFSLCLISLICIGSSAGQTENLHGLELKVVEACRVELTPLGRQATFQLTGIYKGTVDINGSVTTLIPIQNVEQLNAFVQVQQFEECMKRWQFTKSGTYLFSLTAGTTGEMLKAWSITAANGDSSLRVVLRRLE